MKIKSLTEINAVASYLRRIGAEPRSLRTAVVKESRGDYWEDIAIITINADGSVKAPDIYAPTEREKAAIEIDCQSVVWPQIKTLDRLRDLPEEVASADEKDIFIFRNLQEEIVMLQLRMERKGEKSYIPYT